MGAIGGFLTGVYAMESLDPELLRQAISQLGSKETVLALTALQSLGYAVICGVFGVILSEKIGLWRRITFEKDKLSAPLAISLIGGLALSVGDYYIFGSFIERVKNSYEVKPSITYILASFTYGGVVEEVMLRLFVMSLIAFIITRVFYKNEKVAPVAALVTANIISALLFAAGHIPATIQTFGGLSPVILIRCFVMNGAFGLAFGWLYRKYGIQYAMLAHFGCHFISKRIWLLVF